MAVCGTETNRRRTPKAAPLQFSPEVQERLYQMQWMESMGFGTDLLNSIMIDDMPELSLVVRLVNRHGPDEARVRLERFLWE